MGLEHLLQQKEYSGEGYSPVIDYGGWRVALLNFHPELLPENITSFHCHDETDEVFVLLQGECKLYIGEAGPEQQEQQEQQEHLVAIHCIEMQEGRVYNVRCGVWHSHTPGNNAKVLIVENSNTGSSNSRELVLTQEQRADLVDFSGAGRNHHQA
jgi:mannose-6-phosphate isomerase-like protein (cupin superfamily)